MASINYVSCRNIHIFLQKWMLTFLLEKDLFFQKGLFFSPPVPTMAWFWLQNKFLQVKSVESSAIHPHRKKLNLCTAVMTRACHNNDTLFWVPLFLSDPLCVALVGKNWKRVPCTKASLVANRDASQHRSLNSAGAQRRCHRECLDEHPKCEYYTNMGNYLSSGWSDFFSLKFRASKKKDPCSVILMQNLDLYMC